jgi:glycosyltransferase involved in cell wall biosynthesis
VGQFAFVKAPHVLAEAINLIMDQASDFEFTWVCGKSHHRQAASLFSDRALSRMRFLDWMNQDDLMKIYDHHGIFVFPSFFEGFGKAFLEAMARGLCVICSDTGGARDIVVHGRNGLLAPVGDAYALCRAVLSIASNPQSSAELSQAARETALDYTWDRVGRETALFYSALLDRKAGVR